MTSSQFGTKSFFRNDTIFLRTKLVWSYHTASRQLVGNKNNFSPNWREVRFLLFDLFPIWEQVRSWELLISLVPKLVTSSKNEKADFSLWTNWPQVAWRNYSQVGNNLPITLCLHKVASRVNLYRFTHFLEFSFGSFFVHLLVGATSPIPFERHLRCPLHSHSDRFITCIQSINSTLAAKKRKNLNNRSHLG